MTDPLQNEKEFLLANLEELQNEHPGKYLLIQDQTVYGAFETFDEGVSYGVKVLKGNPFLVRNVMEPRDQPVAIPALMLGIPNS